MNLTTLQKRKITQAVYSALPAQPDLSPTGAFHIFAAIRDGMIEAGADSEDLGDCAIEMADKNGRDADCSDEQRTIAHSIIEDVFGFDILFDRHDDGRTGMWRAKPRARA